MLMKKKNLSSGNFYIGCHVMLSYCEWFPGFPEEVTVHYLVQVLQEKELLYSIEFGYTVSNSAFE